MAVSSVLLTAQTVPDLEFTSSSAGGQGPAFTSPAFTFLRNTNNPTGNTFVAHTPMVTATFSVSNPQYTGTGTFNIGGVRNSAAFGATQNSGGTAALSANYNNTFLNSPDSKLYTSSGAPLTTGITPATNTGARIYTSTGALRNAGVPTTGTYYMTDMTITFNNPVNLPSLHIAGSGSNVENFLGYSTQFELVAINGITAPADTVIRISGNPTFAVAQNLI